MHEAFLDVVKVCFYLLFPRREVSNEFAELTHLHIVEIHYVRKDFDALKVAAAHAIQWCNLIGEKPILLAIEPLFVSPFDAHDRANKKQVFELQIIVAVQRKFDLAVVVLKRKKSKPCALLGDLVIFLGDDAAELK